MTDYIKITPKTDRGQREPERFIMKHAIAAFYSKENGDNVIVLMDGMPATILETPDQIRIQLDN